MSKRISVIANIIILFFVIIFQAKASNPPSWFSKPHKNNSKTLYGVGEGASLEEATKNALADTAGKLVVSISSESRLIKEENQNSFNEELRQKVNQSIEKINFSGYEISDSDEINNRFYVEVSIERDSFINEQKERIEFIKNKIANLDKNSSKNNPIQRRVNLIKILDLCKELELKARILSGAQEEVDLKSILSTYASYQNEFEKSSSSIEFFFDNSAPKDLIKILRTAMTKQGMKITKKFDKDDVNQILINTNYTTTSNKIYGAYIAKLDVDIENYTQGKVVASNNIEISGSSTINESEAIKSAIKSLEEKIEKDGILKVLGILN